jgi:hypothetical protein
MKLFTLCIAVISALVTASCARAPKPELVFEIQGLMQPESVLAHNDAIYISNVYGNPTAKDGNGYISRADTKGILTTPRWADGLNAPKGMAIAGDILYVTDIDEIAAIALSNGTITARYPIEGAQFLNDAAAGPDGSIYVSDMFTGTIHRLKDGAITLVTAAPELGKPNGLAFSGKQLLVAQWESADGVGGIVLVDPATGKVTNSDFPITGNLDGLAPFAGGAVIASDWMKGTVTWARGSDQSQLLSLGQGSADISADASSSLLYVPMMEKGRVAAYRLR